MVVSRAEAGMLTAARFWASGPMKPYTMLSRTEGCNKLLMYQRGFFTSEMQSRALSDTRAIITGDSNEVLSSFVSKVSGGSTEQKKAAIRNDWSREDVIGRVIQLMP